MQFIVVLFKYFQIFIIFHFGNINIKKKKKNWKINKKVNKELRGWFTRLILHMQLYFLGNISATLLVSMFFDNNFWNKFFIQINGLGYDGSGSETLSKKIWSPRVQHSWRIKSEKTLILH